MKSGSNKFKTYLMVSGILAVLVFIGYIYVTSSGWTYSVGTRSGVVNKFSRKGTMFKTWEGELSMGAIDQGGVREKWEFSVLADQTQMTIDKNDNLIPVENGKRVIDLIQETLDVGHRVKLLYRQQRGVQSWRGQTDYFIINVERVGDNQ